MNKIGEQLQSSKLTLYFLFFLSVLLFSALILLPVRSNFYSLALFFGIVISSVSAALIVLNKARSSLIGSWKYLMIAGVLIRFAVALQPNATIDMSTWTEIAETVLSGGDLYKSGRVVWTPVWPFTLGALMQLSKITGIYFYFLVRTLLLINNILILYLLRAITKKLHYSELESLTTQLLYFLNPLAIITTIYHPQFGSIAFTALLGYYYMTISLDGRLNLRSSLLLSLGTAVKQITLPALIVFSVYLRGWRSKLILLPSSLIIFFLLLSPYYIYNRYLIESTVFSYTSRSGYFGLWSMVFDYSPGLFAELMEFKMLWVLLAFIVSLLLAVRAKSLKKSLPEAIQISFLGFLIMTPGWAIQYLFWLLPFGALLNNGRKQMLLYSVFGSLAYLEYFYGDWILNPQLFLPFVYLTLFWWLQTLLKAPTEPNQT